MSVNAKGGSMRGKASTIAGGLDSRTWRLEAKRVVEEQSGDGVPTKCWLSRSREAPL